MPTRRTAGGIFWGLTLIVLGALLLARNLGYNIRIWGYVARYWPVFLIIWGGVKLVDYYRFKNSSDKGALFPGGEVALLVFVIFAGAAITTAANLLGDLDLWDITGNNFTFEEHQEAAIPQGSEIEIVNLFGDVEVRPFNGNRALLNVKKSVRASSGDEAERLANDFTFSITNEGNKYRIASSQDRILRSRQRYKSSLTVRVPKRSSLRISNRNGRIEVADLAGSQDVSNRFGSVELRNITGNVKVSDSFGRIQIENIQGDVTAEGRNGDLFLSFDKPPQRDVQLTTNFGNVTVELPANSSFRLDAHTQFGRIDSNFQGIETSRSDFSRGSAQGQIGERGPEVKVLTSKGNIHLVRRG